MTHQKEGMEWPPPPKKIILEVKRGGSGSYTFKGLTPCQKIWAQKGTQSNGVSIISGIMKNSLKMVGL